MPFSFSRIVDYDTTWVLELGSGSEADLLEDQISTIN